MFVLFGTNGISYSSIFEPINNVTVPKTPLEILTRERPLPEVLQRLVCIGGLIKAKQRSSELRAIIDEVGKRAKQIIVKCQFTCVHETLEFD